MRLKLKNGSLETIILFIVSPFLSIPFIIYQLKKRDKNASVLLALLIGIMGYLYVPAISNDKAKYYERYELFKTFSLRDFFDYLVTYKIPDFIFDLIIYLSTQLNIRLEFMFFILNFLCVYLLFSIVNQFISKVYNLSYNYLLLSFFLLFSFSLPSLFSGLRFTFGSTVLIFGIFNLLFKKKYIIGFILILIATQVHFGLLFFIPAILIVYFDRECRLNYRFLFLLSLSFFLIPSSIVATFFSSINLSDSLSAKTSSYVESDDFVSQNFDSEINSYITYLLSTMWYYIMILYFIIFKKKLIFDQWSKKMVSLLLLLSSFVNFTYSFTTIFSRYLLVIKLLFFVYIIYSYLNKRINYTALFYILLSYMLTFIVDINILRNNFLISLFSRENLLMIQIISNKMNLNEFLN